MTNVALVTAFCRFCALVRGAHACLLAHELDVPLPSPMFPAPVEPLFRPRPPRRWSSASSAPPANTSRTRRWPGASTLSWVTRRRPRVWPPFRKKRSRCVVCAFFSSPPGPMRPYRVSAPAHPAAHRRTAPVMAAHGIPSQTLSPRQRGPGSAAGTSSPETGKRKKAGPSVFFRGAGAPATALSAAASTLAG